MERMSQIGESVSNSQTVGGSLGVSYGLASVKASFSSTSSTSSDFEKENSFFQDGRGETVVNGAECDVLKITIDPYYKPLFTLGFINALKKLQEEAEKKPASNSEKKEMRDFFERFGTHFLNVTNMGATFRAESKFTLDSLSEEEKDKARECSKEAYKTALSASVVGTGEISASFKQESEKCTEKYGSDKYFNENQFR